MKARMKPVFSQEAKDRMIKQLLKAHKAYHAKLIEYAKKGKDPSDIPPPKYLITEGLKEHIDNFLIIWGELEEIAVVQEKVWGKKALEIHDALITKMMEYMVDENAKAYSMLCVVNPAASDVVEEEEEVDE